MAVFPKRYCYTKNEPAPIRFETSSNGYNQNTGSEVTPTAIGDINQVQSQPK